MRVAVTADVHLRTRGEHSEPYNALENIFQQMSTEGMENLLVAGDLFDKDFSSYSEFEELCKKYSKLRLHIIPGNHDPGISGKSIVGDNINIYTDPTALQFGSRTFLLIPYEEKGEMGEKIAEMEKEIEGKSGILVAHGDYYGGLKELNPLGARYLYATFPEGSPKIQAQDCVPRSHPQAAQTKQCSLPRFSLRPGYQRDRKKKVPCLRHNRWKRRLQGCSQRTSSTSTNPLLSCLGMMKFRFSSRR